MLCEQHFASKLMLISTASISKNMGFSSIQSSSLHILNNILIKFLEQTAKEICKLAEMRGENAKLNSEDAAVLLLGMHFSIDELSLYLNSVAHFPFLRAVPTFPAQICQGQNIDENFNTMDITAMLDPAERIVEARKDFPTFAGKSWRQLAIDRCVADINLNGTLDSLASPILDLRRMSSRKKVREMFAENNSKAESQTKKIDNSKSENWNREMDNETGLKSVLSKKGLTLRLLNSNADTPPGFYSSRSIIGWQKPSNYFFLVGRTRTFAPFFVGSLAKHFCTVLLKFMDPKCFSHSF